MRWSLPIGRRCEGHLAGQSAAVSLVLMLTAVIACREQATAGPSDPSLLTAPLDQLLVGEARAMLQENGQLKLPAPSPGATPSISRERAEAIAALWPGQFGVFILPTLEQAHGAPIDLTRLKVCRRTLYVDTPYDPSKISGVPDVVLGVVRRAYGPWWMVHLCGVKGVPQVIVSVSAYATEITIEGNKVGLPAFGGDWMRVDAMPLAAPDEFPLGPERAIRLGAARTGSRVAGVPTLVVRRHFSPSLALWRVPLERSIRLRTDKRLSGVEVGEVYVGYRAGGSDGPAYFIPAANQPLHETTRIAGPSPSLKTPSDVIEVEIPSSSGQPTVFEVVTVD
jgi:hypothetical protein